MCSYDQYNGCYDQILSGLKCVRECSEVENYNPNKIDPKNTCTSGYIYLLFFCEREIWGKKISVKSKTKKKTKITLPLQKVIKHLKLCNAINMSIKEGQKILINTYSSHIYYWLTHIYIHIFIQTLMNFLCRG